MKDYANHSFNSELFAVAKHNQEVTRELMKNLTKSFFDADKPKKNNRKQALQELTLKTR